MDLKCFINGKEYSGKMVQGVTFSEEYNETLDSGVIILDDVEKIQDLRPYDDVVITGEGFRRHLLVDQFSEEIINVGAKNLKYKYKIELFSETKRLETIQLPNFSITQPRDITLKKSVYNYIVDIVDIYNIKYKGVFNAPSKLWKYKKKYTVDPALESVFGDVFSPDFTLNNPNLRDVLSQLMLTKDMIPYVEDDMIKGMDITKRNGDFSLEGVANIVGSRSSDNHCDQLKRTYSNALSQDSSGRLVEYLGFRNSADGFLSLDNLRLETRYPIYKINRIYMCYYKQGNLLSNNNPTGEIRNFLCKQDITPFVKLNSERNLLSEDWTEIRGEDDLVNLTFEELQQYKMTTVGYDIGSNTITGWGQKYDYIPQGLWWNNTKSYVENLFNIMERYFPYGIYGFGYVSESIDNGTVFDVSHGKIITPFSNETLGFKSLFFQVDYKPFYNGTVYHSKDNDRDDIVVNDNSSSSLTLLEQDGIFQKEKANRFGNKVLQINALYDSPSKLQKLGSVLNYGGETDVVIYHREYAINDKCVVVTYLGSQDYVLKNYYTSVYAKHRPYNLMNYDESVRRSENRKMYVVMSKDKTYYEDETVLHFSSFNNGNFLKQLLSFFKGTELGKTKNDFKYPNKVNFGFYQLGADKYASDVNAFAIGNSVCFNIAMYDNVSGGVGIDKNNLEPSTSLNLTVSDDLYAYGSKQKWYLSVDDVKTGFIDKLGFYVGHIDLEDELSEMANALGEDEIKNLIKNKIFSLPLINFDTQVTNRIGNEFLLKKDNKELIDMTLQFELITNDDAIFFSDWVMRLSDLLGTFKKFERNYTTEDINYFSNEFQTIETTLTTSYVAGDINYLNEALMIFQFNENFNLQEGLQLKGEFVYDQELSDIDGPTQIVYYSFKPMQIVEINEAKDTIKVSGWQTVKTYSPFIFGLGSRETYIDFVGITFKRVYELGSNVVPSGKVWFSNCTYTVDETNRRIEGIHFNSGIHYDNNNKTSNFIIECTSGNSLRYNNDNILSNSKISSYYSGTIDDAERTVYSQNLFIVASNEKIKKENVYNEYEEISPLNIPIALTFRMLTTENGFTKLRINLPQEQDVDRDNCKSISLWYKNEVKYENDKDGIISDGEKGYHFVFGVNVSPDDWERSYIDINLSLISLKDTRVFDDEHNVVGHVKTTEYEGQPMQYYEEDDE